MTAPNSNANDAEVARAPFWKPVILLGALLAFLALVYFSPLRNYLAHFKQASEDLSKLGPWAPVIFTGGVMILVAAGFPRLLFCVIGGLAFGFYQGFLWSQLGTIGGSYLTFLFVRWGGREFVLHHFPKARLWASFIHRQGVAAVILTRQLPLPGILCNLVLGVLPVRHAHFLLGTMIGVLPEAIPCTLIGSGALRATFAQSAAMVSLAVLLLAAIWMGSGFYLRSLSRTEMNIAHGRDTKT